MTRVVLDTNVYVSARVYGGKPAQLWRAALENQFELVSSTAILAEAARVLGGKFAFSTEQVTGFVAQVIGMGDVIQPSDRLEVIADESDNRVLECAVEGGAELIVSGDSHLLDLQEYQGIEIITVAEALGRLGIGEDDR